MPNWGASFCAVFNRPASDVIVLRRSAAPELAPVVAVPAVEPPLLACIRDVRDDRASRADPEL